MSSSEEMLHHVGSFEPFEARKVLGAFEAAGIPFEVEADHSALAKPGRWLEQQFGMFPEGSKVVVFVPASSLAKAEAIVSRMFPV
jgi:hypothetical protein